MTDRYPIPEFLRKQPAARQAKERPIIFSAPMVRSLLAGTKTQTRRHLYAMRKCSAAACFHRDYPPPNELTPVNKCWALTDWRKAKPGDRLYVKERHAFLDVRKSALSQFPLVGGGVGPDIWNLCVEYSDGTENDTFSVEGEKPRQTRARGDDGWRLSIHMPRWASRILLEIVEVRVERLNDISEADAIAEGVTVVPWNPNRSNRMGRDAYRELWESINGPGSWEYNPYVWVLSFRRIAP